MAKPIFCHMLIGPPGCGKSTLAQQWVDQFPSYVWVSTDHIRHQLYGDARIQGNWHAIEFEVIRQIKEAIAHQRPVIYDATNARRKWRTDLLKKLDDGKTVWIGWVFHTPLEVCTLQNQMRARQIDESVIKLFYRQLHNCLPSISEGFTMVSPVPMVDGRADMEAIATQVQHLSYKF